MKGNTHNLLTISMTLAAASQSSAVFHYAFNTSHRERLPHENNFVSMELFLMFRQMVTIAFIGLPLGPTYIHATAY